MMQECRSHQSMNQSQATSLTTSVSFIRNLQRDNEVFLFFFSKYYPALNVSGAEMAITLKQRKREGEEKDGGGEER